MRHCLHKHFMLLIISSYQHLIFCPCRYIRPSLDQKGNRQLCGQLTEVVFTSREIWVNCGQLREVNSQRVVNIQRWSVDTIGHLMWLNTDLTSCCYSIGIYSRRFCMVSTLWFWGLVERTEDIVTYDLNIVPCFFNSNFNTRLKVLYTF